MPLVGDLDDPRRPPRVELSLAGRYENYSDFGNTFNPKVGLRWIPLQWLKLRTSWGTSFKAPKLLDLYDRSQDLAAIVPFFPDPHSESDSGYSVAILRQGAEPNLDEETATTWTAGIDISPESAPGFTLSLTYFDIDYQDRIVVPGPPSPFDILSQEAQWAEVITRSPDPHLVNKICESPEFDPDIGGDCGSTPPSVFIDYRLRNLAITRTRGVDLKFNYQLATSRGEFEFGMAANYKFNFDQAFTGTAPEIDLVNTVGSPLALRFRGTVEWNQHGREVAGWRIGTVVDHSGGYRDVELATSREVDAFTSIDLQAGYRTGHTGGWFGDAEILLTVTNVFNSTPPFIDREAGYDFQNADPIGRIVGIYTQKSW